MKQLISSLAISVIGMLLPTTAIARPLSSSGYPIVSPIEAQSFICFARTEDNKWLDLKSICQKANSSPTTSIGIEVDTNNEDNSRNNIDSKDFCNSPSQKDFFGNECGLRNFIRVNN
ncbi:hypothetical protein Cylst_4334 [Cylindrospermum stagnale PCC 7417]|uniref:Uncharacterized protein n=1 Tax=Cylindrospermum stagnale PCC 7417 TaxID=56107 RepID=K9X418_9NOST|nr:hypothetical protein [Cylindrospermum stagnale]AFZ26427.1 hypothetical protein Cylst_4334 [Cylindrospermum stagnale PCC 7417]